MTLAASRSIAAPVMGVLVGFLLIPVMMSRCFLLCMRSTPPTRSVRPTSAATLCVIPGASRRIGVGAV